MLTTAARGTHLRIQGLSKQFGKTPVLEHIDLEIRPGEFVAIVGKSGSGKSTLLRLLAGLDTPSRGQVLVNDAPLRGLNHAARVMFQDARLLPWKRVVDNVALGLGENGIERAEQVLEHIGLLSRAHDWPAVLSGGQRQRVALARALVTEPRLLLLDEPLGALDALTRIEMQRLLETLWQEQQCTAVLITHDVEEAVALADRVILIEHGHIAMDLPIHLPRPRQRGVAAFAALKERVLNRVMGEQNNVPAFDPEQMVVMTTHLLERHAYS